MIELVATIMFAANDDFTNQMFCYASKRGASEQVLAVTKGPKNEFNQKGLRWIECPESFVWTKEAAEKQCAFLDHYDEEQRVAYEEQHGVSPDEVCNAGREAVDLGLKPE